MLDSSEVSASKVCSIDLDTLRGRLTSATCTFSQHLATQRGACLAQIWVPDSSLNGATTLHTQGVPFSVAGCADLLALFRCVSCRYKFSTDITKPVLMGAVGRVFTTGEPEMCHNVQKYDKRHFLRIEEARRCRVHSALFMPLYTSADRRQPFAVFEVVQADGDVLFPVLVQWLKSCLQEVQLFTADADQQAMTMGLRTHAIGSPRTDPPPQNGCTTSKTSIKEESKCQDQTIQPSLALHTHCSATSLHSHGLSQGLTASGDPVSKLGCKLREVTADSEEVKRGSSGETDDGSAQSSNPAVSLGPCHMSSTQQQHSGEAGSGGSIVGPVSVGVASCPPASLVAVGKTLQLQVPTAAIDLQTPMIPADKRAPVSSAAVQAATAAPSPFSQNYVQQQQQHHLHFLANALQLQSQLNAHAQLRPPIPTPATGGSAFAGCQPSTSQAAHPHPKAEEEEGGSPRGEEDLQVNNRVAGGAGKRLSVEDLQSQFGVGLREAAHNLRICPTTLKRACRRHGIYRWPRRQGWAGEAGPGDSMSLDGDSVSSVGLVAGADQPGGGLTLAQGKVGRLASSSSGPLPGPTLEAFQDMDSSAQLAFLHHLAATKRDTVDTQWLQGSKLSAALKLPAFPRPVAAAVPRDAGTPQPSPARQLGSGLVVSMLAKSCDTVPTLTAGHVSPSPGYVSPLGLAQQSIRRPASALQQPSMARQHSMPALPCQQAQHGLHQGFTQPSFQRQNSTGVLPGLGRQGSAGLLQGIAQQPHLAALSQGISQQPHLAALSQGIGQQPNLASHFSSGLLHQLPAQLGNSSNSCFTSMFAAQPASMPYAWQQQPQQQPHQQPQQQQQTQSVAATCMAPRVTQQTQQLMVAVQMGSEHYQPSGQASVVDSMGCMMPLSPVGRVVLNGASGQGSAAMQLDSSDHGLDGLDLLGGDDLSLDHATELDFDAADCLF